MLEALRFLLQRLARAEDLTDVNIAAGEALQLLEQLQKESETAKAA